MKKITVLILIAAIVLVGWFVWTKQDDSGQSTDTKTASASKNTDTFDRDKYSLDDANSMWTIVNKLRPLNPKNYVPGDLTVPDVPLRLASSESEMQMRQPAATALEELFAAASKDNLSLKVASAYRSYSYQQGLYNHYVEVQGKATADTQSARPGHSEHQTGLAVDVEPNSRECEIEECFGDMPEGKWVAANAYKYGFVIRYPKNKQGITGYIYEPWHLRFVGKELATEVHSDGDPTLEEFFDLPAAPDYR